MITGFLSPQEVKTPLSTCAETSMKKACLDVKMTGTFYKELYLDDSFCTLK